MDAGTLKKHFATLIMGAFALAVGFFWFEAIKKILEPVSEHFGTDTWQNITISHNDYFLDLISPSGHDVTLYLQRNGFVKPVAEG